MRHPVGALTTQLRVLRALLVREAKARFGRHYLGLIWEYLRVGLLIAVFAVVRDAVGGGIHRGMPILPFVATGVIPFWAFRTTVSHVQTAASTNRGLLQFPAVTTLDAALARWLLEAAVFLSLALLFSLLMTYGLGELPAQDLPVFLLVVLFATWFGLCIGLVFGSITLYWPPFRHVSNMILRFLVFASGIFYVLAELPIALREVLQYNPAILITELARAAYFQSFTADLVQPGYLALWVVGALTLALVLERSSRQRLGLLA